MSECDRDISDIKNGTKNIQKRKLGQISNRQALIDRPDWPRAQQGRR